MSYHRVAITDGYVAMKLVLVDGSRSIAKLLAGMLEKVGHSVQVFTDGAVALDYMMTQPFDVLVTALEICNVNGFDLCAYARTRNEQGFPTYAIAMSSIQDTPRIIEALDRGADDFTEKTPRIEELVARLRVAERFLKAQHNLIRLATIDPLSGLYNRRAFFEEAARSSIVAEANRAPCAFVMLDIDHFKRINDAFGHDAGDHAIKGVAQIVRQHHARAGRIGGEEFAVFLANCDEGDAYTCAERLRSIIAATPIAIEARTVSITASFGVAAVRGRPDPYDLYKRADEALYLSKSSGRNRVSLFEPRAIPA